MQKLRFTLSAFIIISSSIFHAAVFAEELAIPPNPNSERIIDNANIFSEQEENTLLQTIQKIETETTGQIAILTIPTLGESDIFDYGMRIVESKDWHIGQDDKDNGLFILIAPNDRKYRFFSGYGLEGILPDLRLQQIATATLPDNFRNENYALGIDQALEVIEKFLKSDPEIISEYALKDKDQANEGVEIISLLALLFFAFIGGVFISNKKEKTRNMSLAGGSTAIGLSILSPFIIASGGIIALAIFWITSQPKNKEDNNFFDDLLISSLSGNSGGWSSGGGFSSSGGFSSFGGGDFGGGGFGGDW